MAGRNRLGDSTSPYLLQHAQNPVDWFEWGDEAFAAARARDVPVFLSVGYAACHWCHVMAHESFEDPATADELNAAFVAVKVDREERPDIDAVYMAATQAMTGQGGWPMSVIMTPDGKPFFAGTYFPPTPRHGMPSFRQVLAAVAQAWQERRGEIDQVAADVTEHLANARRTESGVRPGQDAPAVWDALSARAAGALKAQFDETAGGFGGAPKFPPSMVIEFLLRRWERTGDEDARRMAESTLRAMALGGLYDQLGGGFARYSVDARWAVPHFEKMLYDNAQLLTAYSHWWQRTAEPLAERVIRETADFMLRELRTPQGGFAASLDADSDGREGAFYVWTPEELIDALGDDDGRWAAGIYGVGDVGNLEGNASTLRLFGSEATDEPLDEARLAQVRGRLFDARSARPRPATDDKVVASWNAFAIEALVRAGIALPDSTLVDAAVTAGRLLVDVHLRGGGSLARASRGGVAGRPDGVLEDYAAVGSAFLALFAATGDDAWYARAVAMGSQLRARFKDGDDWFDTPNGVTDLIVRPRDIDDNVTPSGQTAAARLLVALAALTGDASMRDDAVALVAGAVSVMSQVPRMAGGWLGLVEALADGPVQIAVVGSGDVADALLRAAFALPNPGAVIAAGSGGESDVPLLAGRAEIDGGAAGYLCHDFVCDLPITDPTTWR